MYKYGRQCANVNSQLYTDIFIQSVQLTCDTCWAMMMDLLMLNFSFLMCNSVYSELPWHKLWTNQKQQLLQTVQPVVQSVMLSGQFGSVSVSNIMPLPPANSMFFLPVEEKLHLLVYHFFTKSDPKWDMKLPWHKRFFFLYIHRELFCSWFNKL